MIQTDRGEAIHLHTLPKQQTMRRAAKVEHAELLALLDVLALLHGDLARTHLIHADADESHKPDSRMIGLDENNSARGQGGQIALGPGEPADINVVEARVLRVLK